MMTAKIQKSLKRYAELAIGLKSNNFFLWTKVKITALFTLILGLFYFAAYLHFIFTDLFAEMGVLAVLAGLTYLLVHLAMQQIREGMQSQKRFISSASHELRTPLSIIRTNAELVLMDKDKASREEFIESMESSMEEVDRMTDILTSLLHMEEQFNNEDQKIVMESREVDLSKLVYDVVLRCNKFAEEKNIQVDASYEDSIIVVGSKPKLTGVVYSIFHNAVSYTPNNGRIQVSLAQPKNSGLAEFVVVDNGIGIPKEDIPHIFDPFYRSKHAEKNGHHGIGGGHFGLGLTMTKKVVQDHSGSIVVKSNNNHGTEVRVSLPVYNKNNIFT